MCVFCNCQCIDIITDIKQDKTQKEEKQRDRKINSTDKKQEETHKKEKQKDKKVNSTGKRLGKTKR